MTTTFKLRIIGRSPAHLTGNEEHVTGAILAGPDKDHLTLCGTLTMTTSEWETLVEALKRHCGEGTEVEDWTATSR